jgi:ABC-type multidrug transport system ATPase subunit
MQGVSINKDIPITTTAYSYQPLLLDITKKCGLPVRHYLPTTIVPIEEIALFNVSARVSQGKEPWLWPNSARYHPQKVNAIIGGSGCGKSTFLDLLRGSIPNGCLTGTVEMKLQNQQRTKLDLTKMEHLKEWKSFDKMKSTRGYVPQDDILFPELTVKENLLFSAFLKLTTNKQLALDLTSFTITKLGMDGIKDKLVGNVEKRGISGGQRKRVNIGMEVVHMPTLLIMDEPTSGLDATGCQNLIEFLKALTNTTRMTIISVIHQPRYTSFMLFDNVILLSKFGTIYEGSPASSLVYFSEGLSIAIDKNENPADVLMDVISGKRNLPQEFLVDIWRSSGVSWVAKCHEVYPLLPVILDKNIIFDASTSNLLKAIFSRYDIIDDNRLGEIFALLGLHVSNEACISFLNKYGNSLMPETLLRVFHEVCSANYCRNHYGNVIERIALFAQTPKSLCQKYTEAQITKHVTIAYRFIRRLMRRIGKRHQNVFMELPVSIENEILIAVMTCKSLIEYTSHNVLSIPELTCKKKKPNFLTHVITILLRKCLSMWRSPWHIQFIIPLAAAFIIGNIQGADYDIISYPNNIAYAMVTLGVLSMITHIRTFCLDKVIIRRETDSKLEMFPYFISYNLSDLIWITLIPLVFAFPYYNLTYPHTGFASFYSVALMVCWWTSGLAYTISAFPFAIQWANLIGVFAAIIFGAFLQGLNPTIVESKGTLQGVFIHISYNRWAMEILTIDEFAYFDQTQANIVWPAMDRIGLCGLQNQIANPSEDDVSSIIDSYHMMQEDVHEQCDTYVTNAYLWLFGYGAIFRLLAIIIMWCNTHPIMLRFFWHVRNSIHRAFTCFR